VDDLVVSDPFPTMDAINLDMRPGDESGSAHLKPSTLQDVKIRNLHVKAFSTIKACPTSGFGCKCVPLCNVSKGTLPLLHGIPNLIVAGPDLAKNNITSIDFENCTIGGVSMAKVLGSADGFSNITWPFVAPHGITTDGKPITPPAV
jgi:hypothetical protein